MIALYEDDAQLIAYLLGNISQPLHTWYTYKNIYTSQFQYGKLTYLRYK